MGVFTKDPAAKLWYGFNWKPWLPSGVTIKTSIWIVPVGLITLAEDSVGGINRIKLSSGANYQDYIVTNHVVFSNDEEDQRSHTIEVRNR